MTKLDKIKLHNTINFDWVKVWLGYPKGLSHFIFTRPLHLNMLLKLNDTFILKIWFYSYIDTLQKYYSMHRMSNLNKFKDSYQVFEKTLGLCLMIKESSKTHKECLNNFFCPKISTTNTLYVNVYKRSECDKNKLPCCIIKSFKKSNFLGFWAIDRTWPALDKFHYFHFPKWKKKKTLNAYIKFGTKSFDWTWKKRWNVRHVMRKVKKKVNLGVLVMSPYISKRAP